MDGKSHELFAQVLLEHVGSTQTPAIWGTAPDIDLPFFHRWYRHRISKLPQIYKEFNRPKDIDTEGIALCESKGIMQDFLENLGPRNTVAITKIIVSRLALHSGSDRVYDTAIKHIAKFTRNSGYIFGKFENDKACEQFERSYADLIMRASGNEKKITNRID